MGEHLNAEDMTFDLDAPHEVYFRDLDVAMVAVPTIVIALFLPEGGSWAWTVLTTISVAGGTRMVWACRAWRDVRRGQVAFNEVRRMFG